MKLYTYDSAPNPRRLALFMKLKGIAIESQQIDLMTGEQLTEDYRRINPVGTVPALVLDDGTLLTEVIGMYVYLEALYPMRPLMGTTAVERALVISWCHRVYSSLMLAIASVMRNRSKSFANRGLPGPLDLPQIPALAERGLLQIEHILPELDAHLETSTWLVGDTFTAADIDLLCSIDFLAWIKQSVPAECVHLHDWYRRAAAHVA